MPTQSDGFVPSSAFSAEDYYVWTRCDGATSFRDIILMVGLGVERTIEILRKLRELGAISVPGMSPTTVEAEGSGGTTPAAEENAPPPRMARASTADGSRKATPRASAVPEVKAPSRSRAASGQASRAATNSGADHEIDLGALSDEEAKALAANVDLPIDAQHGIIAARRNIGNYFDLLGVEPGVGKRQLKRAYFRFSKTYHPDNYFGHDLGPFGPWLQQVFETSTRAFNELADSRRRKAYEARVLGLGTSGPTTQTREEHAEELFERACEYEISGDADQAIKLFGAACRINPKPRFVSRAARCALRAKKLGLAEDYAKTAASLRPKDPSYARLLADVYRAAGRLDEAETTILRAIELNGENDVLMAELSMDLEKVQRAKSAGSSGAKRSER